VTLILVFSANETSGSESEYSDAKQEEKAVSKANRKKKIQVPKKKDGASAKPSNNADAREYEGPLKTLEEEIIRLQEQINKQNMTIDHFAGEILKMKNSGNKVDLSQLKKATDSKHKIIFDTLNVQQSCLDSIRESLDKNSKQLNS
jgi:hypothetical protein